MRTRVERLTLLLFVAACGPQQPVPQCSQRGVGVTRTAVPVVFAGQPVEVELLLRPAVFCQDGNPVSTNVVTEVVDAQNHPVAHEHTDPTSSDTRGYATTVTFTPATRGAYYLSARFEPALGIAQRELQVLGDRAGDVPVLRMPLASPCDEVWALERAVLCRRGQQLSVLRDGGVELSEPITGVASSGGVGWWWTDARVTRAEEVDGGLVRVELPLSLGAGPTAVTAQTFTRATSNVVEVRVVDGGLGVRRWLLPPVDGGVAGAGLSRAGEVVGYATATQVCAAAPDASVACLDSALAPGAGEGDVLWLRGAETGVVALARIERAVTAPVVLFLPAQSIALTDTKQGRPAFTWNGRYVAVRADDLTLEAWLAPGLVARQSVTGEHVFFQLQSGELVVYRR